MNPFEQLDNFTRYNDTCIFFTKDTWEIETSLIEECRDYLLKKIPIVEAGLDEFTPLDKVAFLMLFDRLTWSNGNE